MEILSAFISACGEIIAAIIGVGLLGGIIKKTANTYFFNYADKKHDLKKVLRRARKSILIIVNCGDNLLKCHEETLSKCMKKGIEVNYLLLNEESYAYMDTYTTEHISADYTPLVSSLTSLSSLKKAHPEQLTVRVFHSILTASYIGIDLEEDMMTLSRESTAFVQVMLYQYRLRPKVSPITYLTTKNGVQFENMVENIYAIWEDGEAVDIDAYLQRIQCRIEHSSSQAVDSSNVTYIKGEK